MDFRAKRRIYWILQVVGWSFYGFLTIAAYLSQYDTVDQTYLVGTALQVLFYIFSTNLLRWVIKRRNWFAFSFVKLIPLMLLANVVFGLANYFFLLSASYFMGTLVWSVELRPVNLIFGVLGPAAMYLLWSLVYFTYHYFEEHNKSLKYENVIKDIELNHLKAQLNPHFIFNALNSIRGLVDENPAKSKYAITQLSNLLRNSLVADRKQLVSFEEELKTVTDYLDLESIRYDERLKVQMDIADNTRQVRIPPMMIQTLVENGIKHGVSHLKEGGTIDVRSKKNGELLTIQIRNSGTFQPNGKTDGGFGLSNTQKRLDLIYGEEASFRIFNESDGTVLTEINLPIDN